MIFKEEINLLNNDKLIPSLNGFTFNLMEYVKGIEVVFMLIPPHKWWKKILRLGGDLDIYLKDKNNNKIFKYNKKIHMSYKYIINKVIKKYNIYKKLNNIYKKFNTCLSLQGVIIGYSIDNNIYELYENEVIFYVYHIKNILYNKYTNYNNYIHLCNNLKLDTPPIVNKNFIIYNHVVDRLRVWHVANDNLI